MKKIVGVISGLLVCVVLLVFALYPSVRDRSVRKDAEETLKIALPHHETMSYVDTHGGFHGDGESLLILTFSQEDAEYLEGEMDRSPVWKEYPLSTNTKRAIYGEETIGMTYLKLMRLMDMPEITNGYWFVLDRQSGFYEDTDLYAGSRASYNVTIALYDTDTRTLYYWEFDT